MIKKISLIILGATLIYLGALLSFDIPLVLGAVLCVAAFFVVLNVVVDILYALLDPRVRIGA